MLNPAFAESWGAHPACHRGTLDHEKVGTYTHSVTENIRQWESWDTNTHTHTVTGDTRSGKVGAPTQSVTEGH